MNVLEQESLDKACLGCDAAYYLVHSMRPGAGKNDFASKDRIAAGNMVKSAESAGLKQIIYPGGLGDHGRDLSHHLSSRLEVGEILQKGPVPVTF